MSEKKPLHPFDGQLMICQNCGRKQRSNSHVSSQWNHVELEGQGFYLCPQCFALGIPTQSFLEWLASHFPPST